MPGFPLPLACWILSCLASHSALWSSRGLSCILNQYMFLLFLKIKLQLTSPITKFIVFLAACAFSEPSKPIKRVWDVHFLRPFVTDCAVCCFVATFAWTADWIISQGVSEKPSVILICRRLGLCGWIVPSKCMWCKVWIQERAIQTVCAMQTCVAKWKCLPKKWHTSSPHVEMLTSQAANGNLKNASVCMCMWARVCACVWVCMPLRGPSVSVFVCCLATSDACANEGKFSCFIWSWKILAGYVVVDSESPPEALGLAAVVCRVVCWCQRVLQQSTPWHYRLLLRHVYCSTHLAGRTVVVFALYPKHMKSKALQTNCAL